MHPKIILKKPREPDTFPYVPKRKIWREIPVYLEETIGSDRFLLRSKLKKPTPAEHSAGHYKTTYRICFSNRYLIAFYCMKNSNKHVMQNKDDSF